MFRIVCCPQGRAIETHFNSDTDSDPESRSNQLRFEKQSYSNPRVTAAARNCKGGRGGFGLEASLTAIPVVQFLDKPPGLKNRHFESSECANRQSGPKRDPEGLRRFAVNACNKGHQKGNRPHLKRYPLNTLSDPQTSYRPHGSGGRVFRTPEIFFEVLKSVPHIAERQARTQTPREIETFGRQGV